MEKEVFSEKRLKSLPKMMGVISDQLLWQHSAGGVAVSGLEMAQNSMRLNWPREEVDSRLKIIMKSIHQTCLDAAAEYGQSGNYVVGANIARFTKVVDAMLDHGLV